MLFPHLSVRIVFKLIGSAQKGYTILFMNIAVIDDIRPEADLLVRFIDQYSKAYALEITVSCFSSGEDFLYSLSSSSYSVAFMDIYMKGMDGLETAGRLWETAPQCLVVFLTVSQEHIWEATRLHCFDYIDKKALTHERIFHVLSDIRRKLPQLDPHLDFSSGNRQIHLPVNKILYILSAHNYTLFGIDGGQETRYRIPFGTIAQLTDGVDCLLLCNRGILLNMDHIIQEESDVYVMKGGHRFPIRKSGQASIKHIYHQYQFKKLENM